MFLLIFIYIFPQKQLILTTNLFEGDANKVH
jgi:hypothetical protein